MAFPPSGAASVRAVPALLPKFPPPVRVLYPSLSLVSIFFFFFGSASPEPCRALLLKNSKQIKSLGPPSLRGPECSCQPNLTGWARRAPSVGRTGYILAKDSLPRRRGQSWRPGRCGYARAGSNLLKTLTSLATGITRAVKDTDTHTHRHTYAPICTLTRDYTYTRTYAHPYIHVYRCTHARTHTHKFADPQEPTEAS